MFAIEVSKTLLPSDYNYAEIAL